jgi:hypothetical protein
VEPIDTPEVVVEGGKIERAHQLGAGHVRSVRRCRSAVGIVRSRFQDPPVAVVAGCGGIFQALVDRGGEAAAAGRWGLAESARLFAPCHRFRAGEFDRERLQRRLIPL